MNEFERLSNAKGRLAFQDTCTGDWRDKWTLDGLKAQITHTDRGMQFAAGPTAGGETCHAVLWTKDVFAGDLKIEYDYTRLDTADKFVNILYVQATGSGKEPYKKDIAEWAELRSVAAMRLYFDHMNLYHLSYAAFGNQGGAPEADYIRLRRYMPETGNGLKGTELSPDHFGTGLFKTGVPHRITVIKRASEIFMHIRNDERDLLCHWQNDTLPPVGDGRIGLRHMCTRVSLYRDFSVYAL